MKSFKRFLKEEYQGPGDLETLIRLMDYEREGKEINEFYYYSYVRFPGNDIPWWTRSSWSDQYKL